MSETDTALFHYHPGLFFPQLGVVDVRRPRMASVERVPNQLSRGAPYQPATAKEEKTLRETLANQLMTKIT